MCPPLARTKRLEYGLRTNQQIEEVAMRRLAFILVAFALGVAVAQAQTGAPMTGKTASSWLCTAPNPAHAIPVGDEPNHAFVVEQGKCKATKGEIGGIKEVDGTFTEFAEAMGDNVKGHGIFVESLANGDKLTITYEFTGTSKNNIPVSGSNKWTIKSGTGKFAGAKGGGTCKGKGNPDGSSNYECTGSYTLAK